LKGWRGDQAVYLLSGNYYCPKKGSEQEKRDNVDNTNVLSKLFFSSSSLSKTIFSEQKFPRVHVFSLSNLKCIAESGNLLFCWMGSPTKLILRVFNLNQVTQKAKEANKAESRLLLTYMQSRGIFALISFRNRRFFPATRISLTFAVIDYLHDRTFSCYFLNCHNVKSTLRANCKLSIASQGILNFH